MMSKCRCYEGMSNTSNSLSPDATPKIRRKIQLNSVKTRNCAQNAAQSFPRIVILHRGVDVDAILREIGMEKGHPYITIKMPQPYN